MSLKNPRITKQEMGLIKGALRRVFGRSELRRNVIDAAINSSYSDPSRKKVKFWIQCTECGKMEAKSNIQLDHKEPVVPITSSFEEMSVDTVIDRIWCVPENLKPICKRCHNVKTKAENKERRLFKKGKK